MPDKGYDMLRVIGIGDSVCDKYLHLGKMFPGGQALNVAVQCRLAGCEAAFIGVCGSDAVARHVRSVLAGLGVDTARMRFAEGEHGYAIISLKDGERVFVTSNKGGVLRENPITLTPEDLKYIATFTVAHTSNNSYMDSQLSLLSGLDVFLSYDFSLSWKDADRLRNLCRHIDAGFFSCSGCTEEETQNLLRFSFKAGCSLPVATMGERGALAFDGRAFYQSRPEPLDPVDTLGAGDAFAAGFLMAYAERLGQGPLTPGSSAGEEAVHAGLSRGALLSAKTCMLHGAFGYGADMEEAARQ